MKNITSERIDEIINSTFSYITENSIENFLANTDKYKQLFEANYTFPTDNKLLYEVSSYFAIMKTVRDEYVEILSRILKELLCEE